MKTDVTGIYQVARALWLRQGTRGKSKFVNSIVLRKGSICTTVHGGENVLLRQKPRLRADYISWGSLFSIAKVSLPRFGQRTYTTTHDCSNTVEHTRLGRRTPWTLGRKSSGINLRSRWIGSSDMMEFIAKVPSTESSCSKGTEIIDRRATHETLDSWN